MKPNEQLSKFQKIPELYPPLIKIFERRGVIVLLAFVAVLALSWAIQANGRYTICGRSNLVLDTRTGKTSYTCDAPQIWPKAKRERERHEAAVLVDINEVCADFYKEHGRKPTTVDEIDKAMEHREEGALRLYEALCREKGRPPSIIELLFRAGRGRNEQLPDVDEANAEWLDKLPTIDELNADLERQRRNQR